MNNLVFRLTGAYLNTMARIAPTRAASQALNLFCYPVRPRLKQRHKAFLDGAEKFQFSHGSTRLQGYRWGRGKMKLLFIHGWQSNTFRWRPYVQHLLGKDTSIYAFDAPGHGLSEGKFLTVPLYSEVIQRFIDEHGDMDAVVGHSIGSFSVLHALYENPSLPIDRLVLLAPPGEATDFVAHFSNQLKLTPRAVDLAVREFERVFGVPVSYYSTTKFAARIDRPGLIIHDQQDDQTPIHYARAINSLWKSSQLIETSGLGHNLRSPKVAEMVCNYLIGSEGSGATRSHYQRQLHF
jgi:pimeloyl-ACP methyl ester carboxylesterase